MNEPKQVKIQGEAEVSIRSYGAYVEVDGNSIPLEKMIFENMGEFSGKAKVSIVIEEIKLDDLTIEGSKKDGKDEVIQG